MTALAIRGLRAERAGATVLHGIDLSVPAGELHVVTGPNGAGKTTLVEAVVGAVPASAGEVALDGERIDHLPTTQRTRRGVAFVPEGRRLFPRLTLVENLRVAARTWGVPRAELPERIEAALEGFPGLRERAAVPVGSLSGGQQQMAAIARALLLAPRALVLDEPSFGLAPGTWASVLDRCRSLAAGGCAVLLVEQRLVGVAQVAHRTHLLRRGRLTELGADVDPGDATTLARYLSAGGPA